MISLARLLGGFCYRSEQVVQWENLTLCPVVGVSHSHHNRPWTEGEPLYTGSRSFFKSPPTELAAIKPLVQWVPPYKMGGWTPAGGMGCQGLCV